MGLLDSGQGLGLRSRISDLVGLKDFGRIAGVAACVRRFSGGFKADFNGVSHGFMKCGFMDFQSGLHSVL